MPTELTNDIGEELRERGHEYGTTTSRPRRTGWFDVPATLHGAETAGVTEIALMKLDILDEMPFIDVCVAYRVDGDRYEYLADTDPSFMERAIPIYERLPGWNTNTTDARTFSDLHPNAQGYVSFLEQRLRRPIRIVSVGPERGQTIYRAA
jgi:adenylosuccinate synthase